MQNPFSTTYNRIPEKTYIPTTDFNNIIHNFSYEKPSEAVYKITGVRGSGKTVLLSKIRTEMCSDHFQMNGWIVYNISPARDMLQQISSLLAKEPFIKDDSVTKNINVSASALGFGGGLGVNTVKSDNYFDIGVAIESFLKAAEKHEKKILICVDEVSKTEYMKEFALEFGKWLIEDLPVYFVCTGLFENVLEIGNVKNLTFFRRGKTVDTKPLNLIGMSETYKTMLHVSPELAKKMADVTNGYAYAFQLLGSLYFEKGNTESFDTILEEFKRELYFNSYEKIWEELSFEDKELVRTIVKHQVFERSKIMEKMENKSMNYSVYRDRLIKKGVLIVSGYGKVAINPPFFSDFVMEYGF